MIALRVKPNSSTDLIKEPSTMLADVPRLQRLAVGAQQQLVAEEHRAFAHHQFAGRHAIHDLAPAVLLGDADLDGALLEVPAIPRHPNGHGAVAFAYYALDRDRGRLRGIA